MDNDAADTLSVHVTLLELQSTCDTHGEHRITSRQRDDALPSRRGGGRARDGARTGRRSLTLAGDIGDEARCQQLIERTLTKFGRLDVLVDNAAFQRAHEAIDRGDAPDVRARNIGEKEFGDGRQASRPLDSI